MSEAAKTLNSVDSLIQAGFTGDQAKSVVIAIGEYRDSQLATKEDFARLELKTAEVRTELEEIKGSVALIAQRIGSLETSTIEKMANLESTLKKDIQSMEYRLVIKLGVFFVLSISIALAVTRVL